MTRRRALRFLLAGFAVLLASELSLRLLLFSDLGPARRLGADLRRPQYFADRWSDEWWTLHHTFRETRQDPPHFDETVGWLTYAVEPDSYAHRDDDPDAGLRPVLLYGDSFAECVTEPDDCWQGLLAETPLGETHTLLNYGTGGYGLDQTYLLLRESLDRFADRDPVVILGILVDDDLDRSALRLRDWPRPLHEFEGPDGLLFSGPEHSRVDSYLAAHPPGIASYLFRFLIYKARVLPRNECERLLGRGDRVPYAQELNRRLLRAIADELQSRDVPHFVVLFHGERYIDETDWREHFLTTELDELGLPYVSARAAIRVDRENQDRATADYYFQTGRGLNHYTPLGNRVVFDAIEDGLAGRFAGGAAPQAR